ncbi:MAG: serine O-acetyltransferase [Patiriisocius sp.]|jgi:serine O-acetyltransferase
MIKNSKDYHFYLEQDRIVLKVQTGFKPFLKRLLFPHQIWEFQKLLRKCEYYRNIKTSFIGKLQYIYFRRLFYKKSILLTFSIPENVFGPGLAIVHYGTIVVNANVKVGSNCRIHACTNIGASGGTAKAPIIGNNVYIAPGVKIYGDINIADNIAFAANAAVNRNCLESNSAYGGVPAKRIGTVDVSRLIPQLRIK